MINELTVPETDFSVNFKASEITVAHKEQFERAVKAYAKKYDEWTVSAETIQDAKNVRAEMNQKVKLMDEKRKEIKNEFDQPLKDFEEWIATQKEEIKKVVMPIDQGIKEMEVLEREERRKLLMAEIAEIAPNYGVEVNEVIIDPSWSNKGNFTTKGKLNKKGLNAVVGEIRAIKAANDQLETNKLLITNYAKAVEQEPESWIVQIEDGATPQEVMKRMDLAIQAKRERLEVEQKEKEYHEAIHSLEVNQIEVGNKVIDGETGEIVNTSDLPFGDAEDPFPIKQPIIKTVTYRLSAPNHLIIQATQYLQGLGIKLEKVSE